MANPISCFGVNDSIFGSYRLQISVVVSIFKTYLDGVVVDIGYRKLCSSGLVFVLDSAKEAFDIILQVGAGTGLLYLLRWFWWRINAWCEVVAMISSFFVSIVLLILSKNGISLSTHVALLITIGFPCKKSCVEGNNISYLCLY